MNRWVALLAAALCVIAVLGGCGTGCRWKSNPDNPGITRECR